MYLYVGKTVRSVSINSHKITFRKLAEKLKTAVKVQINQLQYSKLSSTEKAKLKSGPYILPVVFSEPERKKEYATGINIVALDIDDSNEARKVAKNLHKLPYNYICHSTFSSTPSNPRKRVLIECTQSPVIDVVHYSKLVDHISSILDITPSPESYKVAQPMYTPRVLKDVNFEFKSDMSLKPLTLNDLQKTNPRGKTSTATNTYSNTSTSTTLASNPVLPLPLSDSDILDTLESIPDQLSYYDWIEIGMALHHQYNGNKIGLDIFITFSRKWKNFKSDQDVKNKWDSFGKSRGKPVTVATLIKKYKKLPVTTTNSRYTERVKNWIKQIKEDIQQADDNPETITLLTEDLPQAISESNDKELPPMAREEIVTLIASKLRELKHPVSVPVLRKECAPVNHIEPLEKHWLSNHVYVTVAHEFYNTETQQRIPLRNFDARYGRYVTNISPKITASDYILNKYKCETVDSYCYNPESRDIIIPDSDRPDVRNVNLYKEPDYFKKFKDARNPDAKFHDPEVGKIISDHFKWLTGNIKEYKILLDFIAFIVQNPGVKINWCVLLQSAQGAGKTFIAEMMRAILGNSNVNTPDHTIVDREYTDWAEGYQFICIEEIRASGSNKFRVMDRIKTFLTNPVISINRKFTAAYSIRNVCNYLLNTNHRDAPAIEHTDRRVCVIYSAIQTEEQAKSKSSAYFEKLFKLLDRPESLYYFFMNHPVSKDFNAKGHAPETLAKKEAKQRSSNDLEHIIREILTYRTAVCCDRMFISSVFLTEAIKQHDDYENIKFSVRKLNEQLTDIGYKKRARVRLKEHDSRKHVIYTHPSINRTILKDVGAELSRRYAEYKDCESEQSGIDEKE